MNGACVCVQIYDLVIKSNPTGPGAGGYADGQYDVTPLIQNPTQDLTATAFVCDCASKAPLSSDFVSIPFSPANCGPGAGGHQSAIVNWRKNW